MSGNNSQRELNDYLVENRIIPLLSCMMEDLIYEKPESPLDFCRNFLKEHVSTGNLDHLINRPKLKEMTAEPIVKKAQDSVAALVVTDDDSSRDPHRETLSSAINQIQQFMVLDAVQRERVESSMTIHTFPNNASIVTEAEEIHNMYVVLDGTVVRSSNDTVPILLRPMHTFCEAAVFQRKGQHEIKSPFTFKASGRAVVARLTATDWASSQVLNVVEHRSRVLTFLRSVSLFNGLPQSQYQLIAENLKVRAFKSGDVIVREGEGDADTFYIITRGECFIHRRTSEDVGRNDSIGLPMGVLRESDFFGELALMNNAPRKASIVTRTPVSTLCLNKATFQNVLSPLCFSKLQEHQSEYAEPKLKQQEPAMELESSDEEELEV